MYSKIEIKINEVYLDDLESIETILEGLNLKIQVNNNLTFKNLESISKNHRIIKKIELRFSKKDAYDITIQFDGFGKCYLILQTFIPLSLDDNEYTSLLNNSIKQKYDVYDYLQSMSDITFNKNSHFVLSLLLLSVPIIVLSTLLFERLLQAGIDFILLLSVFIPVLYCIYLLPLGYLSDRRFFRTVIHKNRKVEQNYFKRISNNPIIKNILLAIVTTLIGTIFQFTLESFIY